MSPTIIEYKKIRIEIYPNDHNPIHVHAIKAEYGNKVLIKITKGVYSVESFESTKKKGMKPLDSTMRNDIKKLVKIWGPVIERDFERIAIKKVGMDHKKIVITKL